MTTPPVAEILAVTQAAAALAAAAFVCRYSGTKWERTPEGRNIMALSMCLLIIGATSAASALWPSPWLDALTAAGWAGAAVVLAWREYLRSHAQFTTPRKDD